jgi:hypothetical protein
MALANHKLLNPRASEGLFPQYCWNTDMKIRRVSGIIEEEIARPSATAISKDHRWHRLFAL